MPTPELQTFEIEINEDAESFVFAVALVKQPAIESNFIAFSKEQEFLTFAADDEQMELIGAAMIPNMKILRKADDGTPYNVIFSKDNIRKASQIFFKKALQGNLNMNHTDIPADSFIFQSYLVDEAKGISSPKGLNLPDGSWVIGTKVTNPDVWKDVKTGKVKGFSVEGLFKLIDTTNPINNTKIESSEAEEFLNILKNLNNKIEGIRQKNR